MTLETQDFPAIDAPSIVGAIRRLYDLTHRRKPSTGYPTGSRLGTCAAQLQMLRFPELTNPEPTPVRTVMGFDEGKRTEDWLGEVLALAFPELVGLRQEPFYFSVPLPEASMVDAIAVQMRSRVSPRLWGTVLPGFSPPTIRLGEDGRVKLKLVARDQNGQPRKLGFVLDPVSRVVWVPTFIDFVVLHPRHGLVVLEAKSMSNYAFKRAAQGVLDYGKRAQLAGIRAATGCASALIAYRKETHHLAEILYLIGTGDPRVVLTLPSGIQETYRPAGERLIPFDGGAEVDWPPDAAWEQVAGEVWTPNDPVLMASIQARVRRVLLAKPGEWHREYGPGFQCGTCAGKGTKVCRTCKGAGVSAKLKKPCGGECGGAGSLTCPACEGSGTMPEAELGFPCSYCPVIRHCYGQAGLRLEVDRSPHFYVDRLKYQAAGLEHAAP